MCLAVMWARENAARERAGSWAASGVPAVQVEAGRAVSPDTGVSGKSFPGEVRVRVLGGVGGARRLMGERGPTRMGWGPRAFPPSELGSPSAGCQGLTGV